MGFKSTPTTPDAMLRRVLRKAHAELTTRAEEAERERQLRMMELLAPDRLTPRPPLVLIAVDAPRESRVLDGGHAFQAKSAKNGQTTEFRTVRSEALTPWEIQAIEPIAPRRVDAKRAEARGILLRIRASGSSNRVRLWIESSRLLQSLCGAKCLVRAGDGAWHSVSAARCSDGEALLPTPRLGSSARSLLTAWVFAPWAFQFIELGDLPELPEDVEQIEICFLGDDPALGEELPTEAIRLNCVGAANLHKVSAAVHVEATTEWAIVPIPADQTLVSVPRVSWFDRGETWHECRPWLGHRHPALGGPEPIKQYILRRAPGADGQVKILIGLVEPQASLDDEALTHLNVEMLVTDRVLPSFPAGGELRGDHGTRGGLVAGPTPLVLPTEPTIGELHSETALARLLWSYGEHTDRLRELLERCAVAGERGLRDDAIALIASIKRFTVSAGKDRGTLELTLDVDSYVWPAGLLASFAAVLERYFRQSAPPLVQTRLVVHTPEGDLP